MGLSFLNKKTWHPGSFGNIEKVWIAEQKQKEIERKQIENMKKLKEERGIEELKRLQVEAGLIPASHLERMDWMYQGPECTTDIKTAEEYLMGPKEIVSEEKRHFTPVFQESYSNPQNEVFTKNHEDPLFVMKKEELKQRKDIENNPYKMKLMLQELDLKLDRDESKSKKKHKKKKHSKKHKKEHSKKKHIKYDNSSSDSEDSSKQKKCVFILNLGKKVKQEEEKYNITLKEVEKDMKYGLIIDSDSTPLTKGSKSILPDYSLYMKRQNELDKEKELRKKTSIKLTNNRLLSRTQKLY